MLEIAQRADRIKAKNSGKMLVNSELVDAYDDQDKRAGMIEILDHVKNKLKAKKSDVSRDL